MGTVGPTIDGGTNGWMVGVVSDRVHGVVTTDESEGVTEESGGGVANVVGVGVVSAVRRGVASVVTGGVAGAELLSWIGRAKGGQCEALEEALEPVGLATQVIS